MIKIWDIVADMLGVIEKKERKWLDQENLFYARGVSMGAMFIILYVLFIISTFFMAGNGWIIALAVPPLLIPIIVNIKNKKFAFSTAMLNIINTICFAWLHISRIEILCFFAYVIINISLTFWILIKYVNSMINLNINFLALLAAMLWGHSTIYFIFRLALLDENDKVAELNQAKWKFRLWSGTLVITIVYTMLKMSQTIDPMEYFYSFFAVLVSAVQAIEGYHKLKQIFVKQKIDNKKLMNFIMTGKSDSFLCPNKLNRL